jgi:uncharacterized secreted protein with C-terminal beta-propeller domain
MRKLVAALTILAALAAALATQSPGRSSAQVTPAAAGKRLQRLGSCAGLVRYAKLNARRVVGPWGVPGIGVGLPGAIPSPQPPPPGPVPVRGRVAPSVPRSGTNVQEEGVDEPDLVKTDGSHLFTVARGKLRAIDLRSGHPRLVDTLDLRDGWEHELLLHGNRLLVLSRGATPYQLPGSRTLLPQYGASGTVLVEVDVSDPTWLRVVRRLSFEGVYLDARLVGASARVVVVSSEPRNLRFARPSSYEPAELERATALNRARVDASRLRHWLPSYTLTNVRAKRTVRRPLVACRNVWRPAQFSGLGLLTVLTFDLDRGLVPTDSDSVATDGKTVYASTTGLYVATERWADRAAETFRPGVKTSLHKFDISEPERTTYRASGEVSGFLLDQWSLSERRGILRVASTQWDVPDGESFVTALAERAGRLVPIGRVGGLGRGERVYAVRFADDVGYVVTFRQIDPLYTLDLSSPTHPRVLGELKIAGYSSYLHPLPDDLLLGIGQDATEQGRTMGTQLSLFDVSNLRRPVRLHRRTLPGGFSEAESEHHAFLYWHPARLTVVPVQASGARPFVGAIGFRVGRSGIDELGRIRHGATAVPIRRSVVVGDSLYTVSEEGVRASDLGTLADEGWAGFPKQ